MNRKTQQTITCNICNKEFKTKQTLSRHQKKCVQDNNSEEHDKLENVETESHESFESSDTNTPKNILTENNESEAKAESESETESEIESENSDAEEELDESENESFEDILVHQPVILYKVADVDAVLEKLNGIENKRKISMDKTHKSLSELIDKMSNNDKIIISTTNNLDQLNKTTSESSLKIDNILLKSNNNTKLINELEKTLLHHTTLFDDNKKDILNISKDFDIFKETLTKLEVNNDELNNKISASDQLMKDNIKQIEDGSIKILKESLQKLTDDNRNSIHDLNKKINLNEKRISEFSKSNEDILLRLKNTESNFNELNERVDNSNNELNEINKRITNKLQILETKLIENDKSVEINELRDIIEVLKQKIDKLEEEPELLSLEEKVNALVDQYIETSDKTKLLKRYVFLLTDKVNNKKYVGSGKFRLKKNIVEYEDVVSLMEENELSSDDIDIEILREQQCKGRKELNLLEDLFIYTHDTIDSGYNENYKSKNFDKIIGIDAINVDDFLAKV